MSLEANEFLSVSFAGGISSVLIEGGPLGSSFTLDDFSFELVAIPDIDVTPKDQAGNPALNFGVVMIGQSKTLQFTISNEGNADLTVTDISKPSSSSSLVNPSGSRGRPKVPPTPPFSLVNPPAVPFTLSPGDSKTVISVQFKPISVRIHTETIKIISNDPDEPTATVNLSGTGIFSRDDGEPRPIPTRPPRSRR